MSILHGMRQAARKIGLEVHRYNPAQSLDARSFAMLSHHGIRTVIDVGANDGGYAGYLRRGGFEGVSHSIPIGCSPGSSFLKGSFGALRSALERSLRGADSPGMPATTADAIPP